LFASGMCATTTTFLALLPRGSHLILTRDCYRRTRQYIAPSLGGVESLIEMPVLMSYWDQTPEARRQFGITDSLVRFSSGHFDPCRT
jgi:cystathionine beta-lyase/cystathionine gamma-synthase